MWELVLFSTAPNGRTLMSVLFIPVIGPVKLTGYFLSSLAGRARLGNTDVPTLEVRGYFLSTLAGRTRLGTPNPHTKAGLLSSVPEREKNSPNLSLWRCLVRRLIEVKQKTKQTKQRRIGK
jgi:hypothetical protein